MESTENAVKIEKLKSEEDWPAWKFQVRIMLQAGDLINFVNGIVKQPRPNDFQEVAEYTKAVGVFEKSDFKAQKIIVTALSKDVMLHVMTCDTALGMWNKLESVFEQKSKLSIQMVQTKFFDFTYKPGDSMAIHSSKLQAIAKQLKDLGEKISDSSINTKLLASLPPEYNHFHSAWESTPEENQTLDFLTTRLIAEEMRLTKQRDNEVGAALVARKSFSKPVGNDRNSKGRSNKSNSKPGKCFLCDEQGHWKRDCPKKRRETDTAKGNTSSKRESDALVAVAGRKPRSNGTSNNNRIGEALVAVAGRKSRSNGTSNNNRRGEALLTVVEAFTASSDATRLIDWFLDSGASDHMTYRRDWFVDYDEFDQMMKVRIGNGSHIYAKGQGSINILAFNGTKWIRKHLENVLYVPDIHLNLFSQNTALDKGLQLTGDSEKCTFVRGNEVVAVAVRVKNFFKLRFKVVADGESYAAEKEISDNKEKALKSSIRHGKSSLYIWHQRFGHQNIEQVRRILKGLNIQFDDEKDFFCEGCVMGKHHRKPFKGSQNRATGIGDLIHADVCGPMQQQSLGGSRYFVLFKDDCSSYRTVYFMKQKSEVPACIQRYLNLVKSMNSTVSVFRSDNGLEFVNIATIKLFEANGVQHQKSVIYTPEQNGRAEREMRTIVEAARSMLHSKNLALSFWAEAVNTAVYILNRCGPSPVKNKSPYQVWFNKDASMNHLRVFGSVVYVHVPKQKRRKLDKKAKKGIFVGYCEDSKAYRIWIPAEKKIEIARDVIFRELVANEIDSAASCENEDDYALVELEENSQEIGDQLEPENANIDEFVGNFENGLGDDSDIFIDSHENFDDEDVDPGNESKIVFENVDPAKRHLRVRIPKPIVQQVAKQNVRKPKSTKEASYAALSDAIEIGCAFVATSEPGNYDEALQSKQCTSWKMAMDDEFNSLRKNRTWELVQLPDGRKLVDNRWVFKVKEKPNGEIERYKARLVVRGFTQEYGIDYEETFSPVVKFTSVRSILAMAAAEKLKIKQFDVTTAFLYGELSEEIYMRQPQGYEDGTNRVCKLLKSLYGLKQASRCWNRKFTKFLEKFDLKATSSDSCVFVSKHGQKKIVLGIFIDDGIIAATDESDITRLIDHLTKEFEIRVLDAKYFIGLEIDQQPDGSIHICQHAYTKKILTKFRMLEAHAVTTPAESQIVHEPMEAIDYPYREAVGSLMYLAIATRPDIAYAVGRASRHLNNPSQGDVNGVKRIFKYLRGTMDLGMIYEPNPKFDLNCYSDSDYGGDMDTRRSTTGFVLNLGASAISWSSQLQSCVALSSTEAEYMASAQAIKELIWVDNLLGELLIKYESKILFVDNQSAIRLIKNPVFHKRTKHIDIMFHFIRERYGDGFFELVNIPTSEQVADIFTKALAREKFLKFRSLMGMA